jgi:CHAD domain-containing protein
LKPSAVTSHPKKPDRLPVEHADIHILLVDALDDRWKTYQSRLEKCASTRKEGDIHDLRVAARRLIAALDLFAAVFSHRQLDKLRRRLKNQLKKLNPLRDVQVEIHMLNKKRRMHPSLFAFSAMLRVREKKIVKEILKRLQRSSNAFDQEMKAVREKFMSIISNPLMLRPVGSAVVGAIAYEYLRVIALRNNISADDTATIHAMRVAFKQFRYMMEIVQPANIHGMANLFRRMHIYQDRMGNIHDCETLLSSLAAFQQTCGNRIKNDLLAFTAELDQNRTALLRAFLESADDVYTFWKMKPV